MKKFFVIVTGGHGLRDAYAYGPFTSKALADKFTVEHFNSFIGRNVFVIDTSKAISPTVDDGIID